MMWYLKKEKDMRDKNEKIAKIEREKTRMKQKIKRRYGAAAVVFWLAVWQLAAAAIGQEVFLVSPLQAAGTLVQLLPQLDFWQRVGFSAGHILLGFLLGAVCSVVCSVAAERWVWVDALLSPVIQLVKATPVASFIILALVWVSGKSLSILISFLMVLPVLYGAVRTGIKSAGDAWGRSWTLVSFGSTKGIPPNCVNKRAAMWQDMRRWLMEGGAISPVDNVLADDLVGPELAPRDDGRVQLESKESMKKRGLPSPNRADALALTFAFPVLSRKQEHEYAWSVDNGAQEEYDPFHGMW